MDAPYKPHQWRPFISRAPWQTGSSLKGKTMKERKPSRRSFLATALGGGSLSAAARLTLTRRLFAQASRPIVIRHHCDLTGVISSWRFSHAKASQAPVDLI